MNVILTTETIFQQDTALNKWTQLIKAQLQLLRAESHLRETDYLKMLRKLIDSNS